jgi:hypothetical protein
MQEVLKKAFDMSMRYSQGYMAGTYDGFYIICRPSQFARFVIYRNEVGQKNGFMDLQAKLFTPEPKKTPMEALAARAGVDPYLAQRVIRAMGMGDCDLKAYISSAEDCDGPPEVDVSMNKHQPC